MNRLLLRFAVPFLLAGMLAFGQFPLSILTTALPQGTTGVLYSAGLTASGGIQPYTWSILNGNLPAGLVMNSVGNITGVPTATGVYQITFQVTDNVHATAIRSLTIFVNAPPQLTITTTSPLPNGTVGAGYSQTLAAINGSGQLQWAAGNGLPPGLTLSSAGVISGTPTTFGSFTFSVQVTDSTQHTATATFAITVNPAALTITTVPPLFNGIVGTPYAQSFSAAGGRPPYTWNLVSGSIPGLALDPNSGILQGTPTTTGTYNLTVQVSDSAGSRISQSFSITVTQPALTLVVSGQLPNGAVGVAYNQKLPATASGGTPPYSWSVIGGQIPGVDFDTSNVAFTGTPTAPGTFSVTVQVRDAAGLTQSRAFSVTIAPASLSITTARQLPDTTFNTPFSQALAAAGGVPPYTWSANGLPSGLNIDPNTGTIGGTPVAAGSFQFAVTVSDTTLNHFSDLFTINVKLPPTPAVTIAGVPKTVSPAQQFPVQISLASAFPVAITGQVLLSFAPDNGPADRTVVFSSGGTTANFTIPAGSTTPNFDVPLAVQTGTVSGTIGITLRMQAGVSDITPSPAPAASSQIAAAAPVIKSATFTRSGSTVTIVVTGYATSREVTQAVFTFAAATGQSLQPGASSLTVSVESLFTAWFQDSNNSAYGSQFVFTQPFTIQGDATQVTPGSVTLTNRLGSVTANITTP